MNASSRIDRLINRQGIIALFIMFAIPGFPKDYLCLALGLSTLPVKLFALMACVGRMPGTLMLKSSRGPHSTTGAMGCWPLSPVPAWC